MIDRSIARNAALLGVALLSSQGTIYLLQLVAAARLNVDEYSAVRVGESLAAVMTLVLSCGLPAVLLVKIGRAGSKRRSAFLIGSVLLMAMLGFLASTIIDLFPWAASRSAPGAMVLAGLMAFRMVLTASAQSQQQFEILAASSVISAGLSLLVFAFVPAGFYGWLMARLCLETAICCILGAREVGAGIIPSTQDVLASLRSLLSFSIPVGVSLMLRALVEHGAILLLASAGSSSASIADAGVVLTIVTIALVPSTVIQGVLVPRLARAKAGEAHHLYGVWLSVGITTTLGFVALTLVSWLILPFDRTANVGMSVIALGSAITAVKMAATAAGSMLLVQHRGRAILLLNILTLAVAVFVSIATYPALLRSEVTLEGVLWRVLLIEAISSAAYLIALKAVSAHEPTR